MLITITESQENYFGNFIIKRKFKKKFENWF